MAKLIKTKLIFLVLFLLFYCFNSLASDRVINKCTEIQNTNSEDIFWNDFRKLIIENKIVCLPVLNALIISNGLATDDIKVTKLEGDLRFKAISASLADDSGFMDKNQTKKTQLELIIYTTILPKRYKSSKYTFNVGNMQFEFINNKWSLVEISRNYEDNNDWLFLK